MNTVQDLITRFSLQPHPEGGYFAETYRSNTEIPAAALPSAFTGPRSVSTAIYFLMDAGNFSAFHRIKSDECWHFYAGQALLIYVLRENGDLELIRLGNKIEQGEQFQYVVPAGCWFASEPAPGTAYSFVGCTVSPGFDFADFELARAEELATLYPAHQLIISKLSRL